MLHLGSNHLLYRQQYWPIKLANNNSSIRKKNNNKQTYGQGKELIKHRNSDWKLHYYRNDIFHRLSTSLPHFLMYF